MHHASRMARLDRALRSPTALFCAWGLLITLRVLMIALEVQPTSDARWYFSRASDLAAGLGYLNASGEPTAYWPPGWPMALGMAFRIAGASVWTVGLVNLSCAAASGWLILDLARKLAPDGSDGELAGRCALLLYAIYPNAFAYVPLALTEVFYTFLLLLITWLLTVRRGTLGTVVAGLVLGFATLVKAQTLAVVPLILGIALLRQPQWWRHIPRAVGHAIVLIVLAGVVVAPWTMRNERLLGHRVVVSTNGGITLFTGNNDSARGDFTPEDPAVRALDARTDLDEVEWDALAGREGIAWIASNPGRFIGLMPLKAFRLWAPDGEGEWAYQGGYARYAEHVALFRSVRYANHLFYVMLLTGFAIFTVHSGWRRWRWRPAGEGWAGWWLLPCGIAAYPTAIALVFSGQSRFHFPVMPFMCIACGWLLADIMQARRDAERKSAHA